MTGEAEVISNADKCPICTVPFKADDLCATDIGMGACHAACLEGSPVVDLETGEPFNGTVGTYSWSDICDNDDQEEAEVLH